MLVGDGPVDIETLRALRHLPIIAVDGGANHCVSAGVEFEAVLGDFDSIAPSYLAKISDQKRIPLDDQNFCDFEKALAVIEAERVLGLGFLGGRMDHSIEALRILALNPQLNIELIGEHERAFVWPPATHLNVKTGARMSFLAFASCHVQISFGLEYELDHLILGPEQMSLSNRASEDEVSISYEGAPLIALIER